MAPPPSNPLRREGRSSHPRETAWAMLPTGKPMDEHTSILSEILLAGDIINESPILRVHGDQEKPTNLSLKAVADGYE